MGKNGYSIKTADARFSSLYTFPFLRGRVGENGKSIKAADA